MAKRAVKVWDLPLRLFHWSLAVVLTGSFLSVQAGEMELHQTFGFLAVTLVLWRVIWGVVGSSTARFTEFVRGPKALRAYLADDEAGTLGHTPLGGLSVLALLGLVLAQAGTGLFANDDIFFDGPWAGVVGKDASDQLTGLHGTIRIVLLAMIVVHILAIAVYAMRGRNLLTPMFTGVRLVDEGTPVAEPRMGGWLAALAALALAAAVSGAAFRYWIF